MPVKERDTPMLVGVSARVSQTRGARVDGDEIKERKRERGERWKEIQKDTSVYSRKEEAESTFTYTQRERRKAKEGRFKRGSRRDGVTS